MLAEALLQNLAPIQERRRYFEAHPEEVREILHQGNQKARMEAQRTMAAVREAIGFNQEIQLWQ